MATSIGEGAARGLEAGFGMGQAYLSRRDQEEQRRLQREQMAADRAEQTAERDFQRSRLMSQDARLAKQDLRQATMDERQQNMDAEAALDAEFKDLQGEGRGLFEQYGDMSKIPQDVADSYTLRVKDTRGRLSEARAKRYAPLVEAERQKAGQLWSRIQTGEIPIEQVPDDQLVSSLTALTRRDVTDFLPVSQTEGVDGGLSPIQRAGQDFMTGAQSGNDEMMLGAANVLFKPELMTGVGGPGRDGSEILSKKIVQLIPHPNDPTHFTPLLEVKVRREDGKVGTYRAPVTENRSSDPNDNIKTLSIQDGLERVGQLTTLAQTLNQRGILAKIAKGINDAGEGPKNFLEAYYATGGQKPKAEKVDVGHFEDFGGYKVHYLPDGREVRINKTAPPKEHGGDNGGETGAVLRNLDAARKQGVITDEEYTKRRRDLALGTDKPAKPEKPMPQTVVKQIQESRDNATAINSLTDTFKPEYGSKGVLGVGADMSMGAKGVLGMDKDAVDWWKNYRKQAELVERHAMFGASLTPGEQASWRSADISPGMDPDVIKRNLQTRAGIARDVANNTRDDLIDAGYGEERVQGIAGRRQPSRDKPSSNRPPISALKEGHVTTFGNGQRWTLRDGQPVQVK